MCNMLNSQTRTCNEPECGVEFVRKHTWENMHYCREHRANSAALERPGQCIVRMTVGRAPAVHSTQAGFMERFMK